MMKHYILLSIMILLALNIPATGQELFDGANPASFQIPAKALDTILASQIPVMELPEQYRFRTLPPVADNSVYPYFPPIVSQYMYYSCQQYSGIYYTFTYEMNRLRNAPASEPVNRYAPHYTWNFLNQGGQYTGVNFLHSFHALMEQGQMPSSEYGRDTAYRHLGWPSGYSRYERAFYNRIRKVMAIPTTTPDGLLTLKHYLNDHLDGSPTGGVVCFTASSPGSLMTLPAGTPEAGKHLITEWMSWATHGMTIVGYNDSIRYDLNEDGQYTNDIDINGDGEVDMRDWEIGGFKLANSYGDWWADEGFCYALYHGFASEFEAGGVWNNCVYVVEPDPSYHPLLGMEFTLSATQRDKIRIVAGVSADTLSAFPEHTLSFPFFNFQGGDHVMQGFDTIPGQEEIELGLDVTPLLSYVSPGEPARYFLLVDKSDPYSTCSGMIRSLTFHDYTQLQKTFSSTVSDIPMADQGTTLMSAKGTVEFQPVGITTQSLPSATPGTPFGMQLAATGGILPYRWSLEETYTRSAMEAGFQGVNQVQLVRHSPGQPFAEVILPFAFPFFGKLYDTVYVNSTGMVQFCTEHLPYPYLVDSDDQLRNIPAVFPAFSNHLTIATYNGDGMWMETSPGKVTFRWKLSVSGLSGVTGNQFELSLYPDGSFEFHYGDCGNQNYALQTASGYSRGDGLNAEIANTPDLAWLSGTSARYTPPVQPDGVSVSESGFLSIPDPPSSRICDLTIRVTDERLIHDTKTLQVSDGLLARTELSDPSGMVHFGDPASIGLTMTNTGTSPLSSLQCTLTCHDTSVVVTDSTETLSSLAPGSPVWLGDAFGFHLERWLPGRTVLPFTLSISSASGTWTYDFGITVSAPEISMIKAEIHDGVNGLLDPGETADLEIGLTNFGMLTASDLTGTVILSDTTVTLVSSPVIEWGSLAPGTSAVMKIRLHASRHVIPGTEESLSLMLTADQGYEKRYAIPLRLGSNPVGIVRMASATSSVFGMQCALDTIGAGYDIFTGISENQLGYPALFLILGTTTGSHFLTDDEAWFYTNYLNKGGHLYMESYAEWHYGNEVSLKPKFRITSEKVPAYSFEELSGVPGSICDGMAFPYTGTSNYAVFRLVPGDSTEPVMENIDAIPVPLQIAFDGGSYRTIGSMVEFGKLADGGLPSTKTVLMRKYLDYFNVLYKGPYPYFHADSTTVCRYHPVHFADDSYDEIVSWHWDFPGGEPSASDLPDPVVSYKDQGVYDVTLTVSDGLTTHSLTRRKFIRVEVCTSSEELETPLPGILVFPNPARDEVRFRLPTAPAGPVSAVLFDLAGKRVRESVHLPAGQEKTYSLTTAGVPDGFYILRVVWGKEAVSSKVLISR